MNPLLDHARAERALSDLTVYLSASEATLYSGRLFDRWARPDLPHFVFDDIVAVKALSVEVPPEAANALLEDGEGVFADLIADLQGYTLADEMSRWEARANEFHRQLKQLDGIAGVIAGKLMHGKLPNLIPIWDDKTQKGLRYEKGRYWACWHRDYTAEVRREVSQLRESVALAADLSDLRVLDIIVWKAHEKD